MCAVSCFSIFTKGYVRCYVRWLCARERWYVRTMYHQSNRQMQMSKRRADANEDVLETSPR